MKESYERISYRYPFESLVLYEDRETGLFGIRSARTDFEKTELNSPERVMLEVFLDREKFGISATEALQVLSTDSKTLESYKTELPYGLANDLREPKAVEERAVLLNYEAELKGEMKEQFCEALYENLGGKPGTIDLKEAAEVYDKVMEGDTLADAIEKVTHMGFDEYQAEALIEKVKTEDGDEKHLMAVEYVKGESINAADAREIDDRIAKILEAEDNAELMESGDSSNDADPFEETAKELGIDLDEAAEAAVEAAEGSEAVAILDEPLNNDGEQQAEDDYSDSDKTE